MYLEYLTLDLGLKLYLFTILCYISSCCLEKGFIQRHFTHYSQFSSLLYQNQPKPSSLVQPTLRFNSVSTQVLLIRIGFSR
ncbi:hypothetical protein Gotur_022978 [Gossypium turneri]